MSNPFMTPSTAKQINNVTEHHKFPLPPEPREFRPTYDNYGRYVLPDPTGESPVDQSFTRVTTGAKALDDTYYVERWKLRSVTRGLVKNPHLLEDVDLYASDSRDVDRDLDRTYDAAHIAAGGAEASEFGTAIHAWAEALELGQVTFEEVPEEFRPFMLVYGDQLGKWGISAAPDTNGRPLVERIVYNSLTGWVGTFDRIYQLADGSRCIGDVKTTKDPSFGWLAIAIQLWDYANADLMLSIDGSRWEPMPEIRKDMAIVAWIPSNAKPPKAEMISVDLEAGGIAAEAAVRVREMRASAKTAIPNRHPIPRPGQAPAAPIPTPADTVRDPEGARLALGRLVRMATSQEDLANMYEAYSEIWTEDLTNLGLEVLRQKGAA